jgi:hypothetical protein
MGKVTIIADTSDMAEASVKKYKVQDKVCTSHRSGSTVSSSSSTIPTQLI